MSVPGWLRREYQGIFLLLLFTASLVLFIQPLTDGVVHTISPDEVVNQYFGELYSNTGDLTYPLPFQDQAGEMLRPRGTVATYDGQVAPSKFLGYSIFAGPLANIIGEGALPYIVPFFGALGVCMLFLLVRLEFGQNIAMISSTMLLFTPYHYWATQYFYEDIIGLSFVLCGLYLTIKGLRANEGLSTAFGGLLLGITVIFKPFYLVFLIPYLFFVFKNFKGRTALLTLAPYLLGPLLFLLLNQMIYGNPLVTGFHLQYGVEDDLVPINSRSNLGLFLDNIYNYIRFLLPVSLFGLAGVCLRLFENRKQWHKSVLDITFIFITIILIIYVLGISGSRNITSVHNSALRYLLIINILLVPYSFYILARILKKVRHTRKRTLNAIVAIGFVLLMIIPGLSIFPAIEKMEDDRARYDYYNAYVTNRTSADSIFICQYMDKYFFPDRLTGNPNFLVSDDKPLEAAMISVSLCDLGYDVYFIRDGNKTSSTFNTTAYELHIRELGYQLTSAVPQYGLYIIEQNVTA